MKRSSILLAFFPLLLLLNPLPAPGALERTQVSDKVYPALKTAEACDRAERERLPICFCYLGRFPPDAEMPADLDRVWRDSTDLLARGCIVTVGRHGGRGRGLAYVGRVTWESVYKAVDVRKFSVLRGCLKNRDNLVQKVKIGPFRL